MASGVLLTACAMFVVTGIGQAQERPSDLVTLRAEVIDSAFRPVSGVLVYLSRLASSA